MRKYEYVQHMTVNVVWTNAKRNLVFRRNHLPFDFDGFDPSDCLHLRDMEQLHESGSDLMHSDFAVQDIPLSHELSDKYDILHIPVQCSLVTLPNVIVSSSPFDLQHLKNN